MKPSVDDDDASIVRRDDIAIDKLMIFGGDTMMELALRAAARKWAVLLSLVTHQFKRPAHAFAFTKPIKACIAGALHYAADRRRCCIIA